jgi:hypothetical protein
MRTGSLRTVAGYVLAASAVVACPCHVVLMLPLLLVLLGGTALGGVASQNPGLVLVAATLYFLVAVAGAYKLLSATSDAPSAGAETHRERCCTSIAQGAHHTND